MFITLIGKYLWWIYLQIRKMLIANVFLGNSKHLVKVKNTS